MLTSKFFYYSEKYVTFPVNLSHDVQRKKTSFRVLLIYARDEIYFHAKKIGNLRKLTPDKINPNQVNFLCLVYKETKEYSSEIFMTICQNTGQYRKLFSKYKKSGRPTKVYQDQHVICLLGVSI